MDVTRLLQTCSLLALLTIALSDSRDEGGDAACPKTGRSLLQVGGTKRQMTVGLSSGTLRRSAPPAAVQVAPGNPGQLTQKPVQCGLTANARHSVRCCTTSGGKVDMDNFGCDGDCSACKSATYLEAVNRCESHGYRLCTVDEALGTAPYRCGKSKWCNTGCRMNGFMFWTGSTCTASCPASVPNFQPMNQLDYSATAACDPSDDHHCFGNGDCVCGTCVCKLGWRGPYCSQLDLLPAKASAHGIPMDSKNPTWGGAAFLENGRVQFLAGGKRLRASKAAFDPATAWGRSTAYDYTELKNGDDPFQGIDPYTFSVSATKNPFKTAAYKEADPAKQRYDDGSFLTLYEASGADAAGPYTEKVAKFLKTFRVDLKKSTTGSLLLLGNMGGGFAILESASGSIMGPWTDGNGNPIDSDWAGGGTPDSSTKVPPPVYKFADHGHCRNVSGVYKTGMGSSMRDCTALQKDHWACHLADPSFAVHPNGTTVIMFRGTKCSKSDIKERLGVLVSASWQGPYVLQPDPIFDDSQVMDGGLEDLFMWIDHRGTHMVVHSQALDHSYTPTSTKSFTDHKKKRGAYLFSVDGLAHWQLSDWELFPSEIRWDNGTTQVLLKQQRPSIIFDDVMQPQYLVTGVDYLYDPCCDWYPFGSGWTLIQPIQTACPAGQVSSSGGSSCTVCSASASAYSGRCLQATSKYGQCVCAQCQDGYKGDKCDIQTVTCGTFQAGKLCNTNTGAKYFPKSTVDNGECLQTCQDYARSLDSEGCCFMYEVTSIHRNCRFVPLEQGTKGVGNTLKQASICSRR